MLVRENRKIPTLSDAGIGESARAGCLGEAENRTT